MEIILTRQTHQQITVACDGKPSHIFDLLALFPGKENNLPHPLTDPVTYGQAVYQALFPPDTPTRKRLESDPDLILLVTSDEELEAIPWEYAYGPNGFVVLDYPFVRGLPALQRIDTPMLDGGLHIVAVPSNPLDKGVPSLDIEGEWVRLKEVIQEVPRATILDRVRPPTLEQLRRLVANQRNRIVHFMGHGGQQEAGAILFFENQHGGVAPTTAKDFTRRVKGTVFLVVLNACVSATPGPTEFSNLAAALAQQKAPYVLGMRFSVADDDARTFSRVLYSELARGSTVEEAVMQSRLALADSNPNPWVVGVPVLYTALKTPAAGFDSTVGTPIINEHQPRMDVGVLTRAEGAFQGRINELKELGYHLTGDQRPSLLTIHGGGGQGKTALAREAVERFAYAWPGGVWAISLESLPTREFFVSALARFLDIVVPEMVDPAEIERLVLEQLGQRRTLIVLDNAETLVEAVVAGQEDALRLAQFIREQLPDRKAGLLATSRRHLEWSGEIAFDLDGLAPDEGAQLFCQSAPQRGEEVKKLKLDLTAELSRKVDGHPLSLRLLGGAFNASSIALSDFVTEHETQLLAAEDRYKAENHRHRKLYASIDTSIRYLDDDLRDLLSGLWIFHAPFLRNTAAAIFELIIENPEGEPSAMHDRLHTLWQLIAEDPEGEPSPIYDQLNALWQRGLLVREMVRLRHGTVLLYHLPPTLHLYIEKYMVQAYEREKLLVSYGVAYSMLAHNIYENLDNNSIGVYIAQQASEDFRRGLAYCIDETYGYYLLNWGWIVARLGDGWQGLMLTEHALETAQGVNQHLEFISLNQVANLYRATGQPLRALEIYEQALPVVRKLGDQRGEAALLNNMGGAYKLIGQFTKALALFEQGLPIQRALGNRREEAILLSNMAGVYHIEGQLVQAQESFEQALSIIREFGDRAAEAQVLNNIAALYRDMKQPMQSLDLFEESLLISREVGDRHGEALTLSNIAKQYEEIGQVVQALALYEEVVPIIRELGDSALEASTLDNLTHIYKAIGQPERALAMLKEVLLVRQEVGDQRGEVTTLLGIGLLSIDLQRYEEALTAFEKVVALEKLLDHRDKEVVTLVVMARLLFDHLNQPQEAVIRIEQAISILIETGLLANVSGHTVEELQQIATDMRRGLGHLPAKQIQQIVDNTIAVMTSPHAKRDVWREWVVSALQSARQHGANWRTVVEFFTAILALLDGQESNLPHYHPYAETLETIRAGIAAGVPPVDTDTEAMMQAALAYVSATDWNAKRQLVETHQALLFQPQVVAFFESEIAYAKAEGNEHIAEEIEFHLTILEDCHTDGITTTFATIAALEWISPSIAALLGGPQEKREYAHYLTTQITQTADEGLKALINVIHVGLFSTDIAALGTDLSGVYRQAWETIVDRVEADGQDPSLFARIVQNTLAVLGSAHDRRNEWRSNLVELRNEKMNDNAARLVTLLDAVIGLLDAEGKPDGLGDSLQGIYLRTWQAIVQQL